MKVPIRYKSSDRYNAGVDVVYDDESKMQYAPFVYATTASGDNGGDDGGEEGEDVMVVNIVTSTNSVSLDKTWTEISNAVSEGKMVLMIGQDGSNSYVEYVCAVMMESSEYVVTTLCDDNIGVAALHKYVTDNPSGTLNLVITEFNS